MDIVVDNDINQYLFQRIKTDEYPQMAKNYSSNVYTNRYFDAKKILSEGSLFRLAVYRMMIMIQQSKELFGQEDFDAFICASLTGACLAAGLSTLFNKPVVYLKNIGPKISADDERMINRIHRGKRYVFVLSKQIDQCLNVESRDAFAGVTIFVYQLYRNLLIAKAQQLT